MIRKLVLSVVAFSFVAVAQAGECKLEGVHLCCPGCVKAVAAALKDAEGVTDAKCDQEKKTVIFMAETRKQASQALGKIRKAGYYGKASFDGKEMKAPESKIEEGAKGDVVAVSGTHLCCGACVKAAEEAIKKVEGVKEVSSEQEGGKISIKGSGISLQAVYDALHGAGFHGTIK